MGNPSCACIPPDGDDWTAERWLRECDYHREQRMELERLRTLPGGCMYERFAALRSFEMCSMDEMIAMATVAGAMLASYGTHGVEVPEWFTDKLKALDDEIEKLKLYQKEGC